MSHSLFGTDGIRGTAGVHPIDARGAYQLGRALAAYQGGAGQVALGRDPRPSGEWLAASLVEGLLDGGVGAVDLGIVPTPAVAFHVAARGLDAGVALSASHNAARENGFKVFGPGGEKRAEAEEAELAVLWHTAWRRRPSARGRLERPDGVVERYVDFALSTLPPGIDLGGLSVALDCAEGATCATTPLALERLGLRVDTVCADFNGAHINDGCGSQHPEVVLALRERVGADIGLAHDGDGDRVVFVDEQSRVVCGDRLLGLLAASLHERGELGSDDVVGTVLTNLGVEQYLARRGLRVHRSAVGDRYVWQRMKEVGADLGGEPSGHVIFRRLARTDDALLTALQVLVAMAHSGGRLCDLAQQVPMLPQHTANLPVREKPALESVPEVSRAITSATALLNGSGRLVVRYSGTEALARIFAEGPDQAMLAEAVGLLEAAFQQSGLAA